MSTTYPIGTGKRSDACDRLSGNSFARQKTGAFLLVMLLPLLQIVDLLYGLTLQLNIDLPVSPGRVFRGGLVALGAVCLFYLPGKLRAIYGIYMLAVTTFIAISIVRSPLLSSTILYELQVGFKALYGIFLVPVFLLVLLRYRISGDRLLFFSALVFYLIGASIPLVFLLDIYLPNMDLGMYPYGQGIFGYKGLFFAHNDIGLTAAMAMAAATYIWLTNPSLARGCLLLLSVIGFVSIGTRTAMVAPAIVTTMIAVVILFARSPGWSGPRKTTLLLRVVCPTVMLSIAITVGVYSFAVSPAFESADSTYQSSKMKQTLSGQLHRSELLALGRAYTDGRDYFSVLLGDGAYPYQHGVALIERESAKTLGDTRLVEMDWFDLYGQYGLLATTLIHAVYIFAFIALLHHFLSRRSPEHGVAAVILGLYLGHSLVAGHALSSPIVSTQAAALVALTIHSRFFSADCKVNAI